MARIVLIERAESAVMRFITFIFTFLIVSLQVHSSDIDSVDVAYCMEFTEWGVNLRFVEKYDGPSYISLGVQDTLECQSCCGISGITTTSIQFDWDNVGSMQSRTFGGSPAGPDPLVMYKLPPMVEIGFLLRVISPIRVWSGDRKERLLAREDETIGVIISVNFKCPPLLDDYWYRINTRIRIIGECKSNSLTE